MGRFDEIFENNAPIGQGGGDYGSSGGYGYGNGGGYGYGNGGEGYSPFTWGQFQDYRNQLQYANQQIQPYWLQDQPTYSQPQQQSYSYRDMTDLEKFGAGARRVSDFINNVVGNTLFGTADNPYTGEKGQKGLWFGSQPKFGEDLTAIKPENAPRMISNIPGMFIGSIPDVAAYGSELLSGTPAMEGNLETGKIVDRKLTDEEKLADVAYTGLSALSFIPGIGVEAKAAGLGLKGLSKVAGGATKFGKAANEAANMAIKGEKTGLGSFEKFGKAAGKKGTELNPYRWGDAAASTVKTAAFESAQEAGQTAAEDLRYGRFDLEDPNETPKRVKEGAFWGGLAGGIIGGIGGVGGTAITNSRAKRGLDRYGNPETMQSQMEANRNYFPMWNKDTDISDFTASPEMHKHLLELEGDQESLKHVGSSMKGVAGSYGQNINYIFYGTRGLRRQYERNADNEAEVKRMADDFEISVDELRDLMENKTDREIVERLDPIIKASFEEKDANGRELRHRRFVISTTRAPATKNASHQTYFVGGLVEGNTVRFAPGDPSLFGGDLDGDIYSLFRDQSMASWAHLPTRKLAAPKALPQKGSGGKANIPYGSPEFDFSFAGISQLLGNRKLNGAFVARLDAILDSYGIHGNNLIAIRNSIIDSFKKETKVESDQGITWKHKLASTLSKLVEDRNAVRVDKKTGKKYRILFDGDDLVSDIITAMSEEGSILIQASNAVEALDPNSDNFLPELESTYDDIPNTVGAMPKGKNNLMQILVWFGKLNRELSTKESPMFRFKQMTAWNAKFIQMSNDLLGALGLDDKNINAVDEHLKWCMQMINNMNLPIDYLETAFKAKCMSEVQRRLGINGSSTSTKFGNGLTLSEVKATIIDVWNHNADIFDEALGEQLTTAGEEAAGLVFRKVRLVSKEDQSWHQAFEELFGNWDVLQLATIDDKSSAVNYTYSGLIESIAESPSNLDSSQFRYIKTGENENESFGALVEIGVKAYQGRKHSQVESCIQQLNSCSEIKADIRYDSDTRTVTWSQEHNAEISFWTRAIQQLMGLPACRYLGLFGSDFFAKHGLGRFLITKDPSRLKRGILSGMVRYNWRAYIDAVEAGLDEEHAKAAINYIDLTNPLNYWIWTDMLARGYEKTGVVGSIDDSLLRNLVDPTKWTYEHIADMFDHNGAIHVRKNSDMLMYYALDDGTSVITGSDLSVRSRSVKNFINAMQNNTMARARAHVEELKSAVNEFHHLSESDVVVALQELSSSHPNIINVDTYAVALHDAGFASGRAAEKAKASRGASLHADSVTQVLGGYSASFLKQLGVSVGSIDIESAYDVTNAIRRAVFDPNYSQKVTLNESGQMVEISQENLFRTVAPGFKKGDEVNWGLLQLLFDKAPQILCQLMPHTYEALTPDAETVTAVMVDTPVNVIVSHVNKVTNGKSSESYKVDINAKKVRNIILTDQDSTLLIFGSLDSSYDQLVPDTYGWTQAVRESADEWSDYIYRLSCIKDDVLRRSVIERNFGEAGLGIGRRTKRELEDIMSIVRSKEEAHSKAGSRRRYQNKAANLEFAKNVEHIFADLLGEDSGFVKLVRDRTRGEARDLKAIARQESARRKKDIDASLALTEAYLQYELGDDFDLFNGTVSPEIIADLRGQLKSLVNEDGNRVLSDDEIESGLKEALENHASVLNHRKAARVKIITRGDDVLSIINKVRNFWEGREYKRLQSEYFKDENAFNDWKDNVLKATDFKAVGTNSDGVAIDSDKWTWMQRQEWLKDQVLFWNHEILSATLQKTYDTYGIGTASNELTLLDEAKSFVMTMVDEAVADTSIEKVATVDPDNLVMPRITFSNPATAPHIAAASIELESGNAPIMSGQNAGSYQYLAILDFIEKNTTCPAALRTGLDRASAVKLAEQQAAPLNYVNDDGSIDSVDADTLRNGWRGWSDQRIATTKFAPQGDCLVGAACRHHNPLPVTKVEGKYIGGRFTIADLCWYLSEKRVFKSKKKRRVFDKISHIVNEAEDLKNMEFDYVDRQTLHESVLAYQEAMANHIMNVFLDEHMEDEFGIDDARIIAQFMTPALEVVYTGQDGSIQHDTISKWSIANDELYATELALEDESFGALDESTFITVRPIAMSLTDVCKKMTHDFLGKLNNDENYTDGKIPKRDTLSQYAMSGLVSWRGKIADNATLLNYLIDQPVTRKATGRSILFGSSPNVMQNFMDFGGSMQRASSYSTTSLINNAITYSENDRRLVLDYNKGIRIDDRSLSGNGRPIIVVQRVGNNRSYDAVKNGRFHEITLEDDNFAIPHAYNAVIFDEVEYGDNPNSIYGRWEEAKKKNRVFLIPTKSNDIFITLMLQSRSIERDELNMALLDGDITVNGEEFLVYDPWKSKNFIDNDRPQTYIRGFDPLEMFLSHADTGLLVGDDSASLLMPQMAALKMDFDSDMEFTTSQMFGNFAELEGSRIQTVDLDELLASDKTVRQKLLEEISARKKDIQENKDTVKVDYRHSSYRIVLPNFDETYHLDDRPMLNSIESYLRNSETERTYDDGTVVGNVQGNDCMNILAAKLGSEVYYIPLIYNRGGGIPMLDGVSLDVNALTTGEVKMRWWGKLTQSEAEGLKEIFPTVAYKTYSRQATEQEVQRAERLKLGTGIKISIVPRGGKAQPLQVSMHYSKDTEDNRLIDAGFQTKIENLGNLGKILPRHFFMKYDPNTKRWVKDYDKFRGLLTQQQVDAFCEWNNKAVWWDYVYNPGVKLTTDPELEAIYKRVALASLTSGLNPLFAFANIYDGKIRYVDFNNFLVYGVLDDTDVERFFYSMDERFCFDGNKEQGASYAGRQAPYVNRNGWLLGEDGKYHQGHLHFMRPTDDSSALGVPSGQVKFGIQQILNESLIEGVRKRSDLRTLIEYARVKNGDPSNYMYGGRYADTWFKDKTEEDFASLSERHDYDDFAVDNYLKRTRLPERVRRRRWGKAYREWNANISKPIEFAGKDGTGRANLSAESEEKFLYDNAIERIREAFRPSDGSYTNYTPLTESEIHRMYKETTASTFNDGRGVYSITVYDFVDWADQVVYRLERGEFPFETGRTVKNRPVIGAVSSGLLDRLMMSDKFRHIGNEGHEWTRDEMIKLMFESDPENGNQGTVPKLMEALDWADRGQREAVYTMVDMIAGTYNLPPMSRPIGDFNLHLNELIENSNYVYDAIEGVDPLKNMHERQEHTRQMIMRRQDIENKQKFRRSPTSSSETGFIGHARSRPQGTAWDTMTCVSRALATMSPELAPSAVIQRFITQGQNRMYIWLDGATGGLLTGNTDGIVVKNREAIKALAKDDHVKEMWVALNQMTFSGEDLLVLQNINSWEELHNLIEQRKKDLGWAGKVQAKAFNWAAGGKVGVEWQIANWVDRLASKITPENNPELTQIVDQQTGMTLFEQMLEESPENFVLDFMTTRNNNPYFMEANQARNWVVDREHAGQSVFGLALSKAFETHPFGRFMFVTGLCRFPQYTYNVGGWFLNHFGPVSSVCYVARSILINIANNGSGRFSDYLSSIEIERAQQFNSFREAMINDALMMGSTALVGLLFGLGAFEPPDDEFYDEYAGRPEEWTVLGMRIKDNWWIMDILGPFAAVAATWKSIEIGKPRLDILQNWMTQALWSNPIVKASDIASTMLDPTEQYLEMYDDLTDEYAEAKGGPPSALDIIASDSITYGLNWFGQFITPAVLREISQTREFMGYERSYKNVVDKEGNVVKTDYLDARIRKATRNNMVLGLMVDAMTSVTGRSSQSGYVSREMPEVRVPDENQKDAMEYFSLYNADGSEKSEEEKQALVFEILCILQSTDDMDALYKEGFVLPIETRIYTSQMLNDMKQYETDQYNLWIQETGGDAYVLGDGNFAEGRKIANQVQTAYKDDCREIGKLFDKLWSDEMNRGLQMYYRLPTTYAKTRSGEWYATGYYPSLTNLVPGNPITMAAGTVDAPFFGTNNMGTMGREGNWETPSAVVEGASAGGRSLVPIPSETIKRPKLSDFADEKNGGYSDTAAGKAYSEMSNGAKNGSGTDNSKTPKSTSKSTTKYPYGGTRYGGGGGYRRGGGGGGYRRSGGGGGSAPNIYAPSVSAPTNISIPKGTLSKANPSRIMNTDRLIEGNEQYLRPDFQTKGSREAYRRSDI